MTNKDKLGDILKQRNPLEERQVITPIDVLAPPPEPTAKTERFDRSDEPTKRTEQANEDTDRTKRTTAPKKRVVAPKKRTEQPNASNEHHGRTVLDDLYQRGEENKRKTERYSFEIYTDQKGSIEELRFLYNKRTGKKLSASRIIREALEEYLTKTLSAFREEAP